MHYGTGAGEGKAGGEMNEKRTVRKALSRMCINYCIINAVRAEKSISNDGNYILIIIIFILIYQKHFNIL